MHVTVVYVLCEQFQVAILTYELDIAVKVVGIEIIVDKIIAVERPFLITDNRCQRHELDIYYRVSNRGYRAKVKSLFLLNVALLHKCRYFVIGYITIEVDMGKLVHRARIVTYHCLICQKAAVLQCAERHTVKARFSDNQTAHIASNIKQTIIVGRQRQCSRRHIT